MTVRSLFNSWAAAAATIPVRSVFMVDSWREVAVSVEQLREFGFFLATIVAGITRDLSKTKGLCEKPRHNRGELLQGSKKTGPLAEGIESRDRKSTRLNS